MAKTHSQAKLCKQKLPARHRALLEHLKENSQFAKCLGAAREQPCQTSVYRRAFPKAQTSQQRLRLFFFFLFLPSFLLKNVFYKAGKKERKKKKPLPGSLGGQIRVKLTSLCLTPSAFLLHNAKNWLRERHLAAPGRPVEGGHHHFWGCSTFFYNIGATGGQKGQNGGGNEPWTMYVGDTRYGNA